MAASPLPAGSLTFFFSDVEGSTRAAAALGAAFAPAIEAHRRAVRGALARNGGREVSTAGDSFFAVFPDPGAAVRAAAEIQREAARDAAALRARIGLHTGQAVVVGDDYIGLDVHRAARISDAAHGGQILVSETTRAALGEPALAGLSLVDLGRHRLKDVGPERVWQLEGDGLPAGPFPALRSLEAHPSNLPAGGPPLVDREAELVEVLALVERSPVVSITGPGGIGKSRLAIAAAYALVERFPDGVFHLDLASAPDGPSVVAALADVVGLRVVGEEPLLPALLDRLRDHDLLLVLDTADRVAGLPALVATIAKACPRIRLLVTSRSRLRIAGERELSLPPLPTDAAVELFERGAADVRPGFSLDEAGRATVRQLVERLDRIPLAIELAAARARILSPAAILDRLERQLPALGEAAADAPERQRTLEAAIAWSCELLAPAEQAAFDQLGVFVDAFDLPAVEGVVAIPPAADPLAVLEELVARSLVSVATDRPAAAGEVADVAGEPRFRLLAPIRSFALAALRASGSEAATRDRHARHFAELVKRETTALDGDAELAAIARLGMAEAELRSALEWCLGSAGMDAGERASLGLEMAARLGRYWHLRGRVAEGVARMTRALSLDADVDDDVRARALQWLGVLLDDSGQPAEASERLEAALELRRRHGDDVEIARILNSLGVVARSMGDLPRAERLLRESLERKEALGDRPGTAVSLSNLGIVAADQGRQDDAVDLLRRALEIDEAVGGAALIVSVANLGSALVHAARFEEGLVQLRRALPGIADLADPELVVEALVALAEVALADAGRLAGRSAARLALAAEQIREREHVRLHDADRRHFEAIRDRAVDGVDPETARALRAEARAVDVAAGVALAREAAGALTGAP